MARLRLEDGTSITELAGIARELSPLSVHLEERPVGDDPELGGLLARPSLDDDEKEAILSKLDAHFTELAARDGYTTRDLVALHPGTPGLDEMSAKFDRCHTHDDVEVRYIVDGEGIFGFVRPDGSQVELLVEAGDSIDVPAGTEHWFRLTEKRRIKAVRYFVDTTGWTPRYTGTEIRFS